MKKSLVVLGALVFLLVGCEQQPPAPAPVVEEPKVEVDKPVVVIVPTAPKVASSQPAGKEAAKPKRKRINMSAYKFSTAPCFECDYGTYNGRTGWHRGYTSSEFQAVPYEGKYGYTNRDDYKKGAHDIQAPRSQDVQTPRSLAGSQDVQAPRGQDVQSPRSQDVQAPRQK